MAGFSTDLSLSNRDIAAESYAQAVAFLEKELGHDAGGREWLQAAEKTSLDDLLDTAKEVETRYNESSHHGKFNVKGWVRGLSSRILHYGGVMDALSQHHPEYLSLAWGMTKFILMGIMSHANLVKEFSKALQLIADVLPRTRVSAALYRTDEMRDAVASLYAHVILFLQHAVKWYTMGPAGRVFRAMWKPFELGYRDTVEQIRSCAETIDSVSSLASRVELREVNVLLHSESKRAEDRGSKLHEMQLQFSKSQADLSATVGKVLELVTGSSARLEEVHLNVADMKPRIVDMHLDHVLGALKPRRCPDEALRKHKSLVRRSSPWRGRQSPEAAGLVQRLGQWMSATESSVLVLQTQPRARARAKEIATELIGIVLPRAQRIVWHLSSTSFAMKYQQDDDEDGGGGGGGGGVSACEVLKSLVFQTLKLNPDVVTSNPANFSMAKLHASHTEEEWLQLFCTLLQQLGACFVVVEAEDVWREDEEEELRLMRTLQSLAARVHGMGATIKLLVVNYGAEWPACAFQKDSRTLVITREAPVPPRRRRPGARTGLRGALMR